MSAEMNIAEQKNADGSWWAWDADNWTGDASEIGRGSTREEAIEDLREVLL